MFSAAKATAEELLAASSVNLNDVRKEIEAAAAQREARGDFFFSS